MTWQIWLANTIFQSRKLGSSNVGELIQGQTCSKWYRWVCIQPFTLVTGLHPPQLGHRAEGMLELFLLGQAKDWQGSPSPNCKEFISENSFPLHQIRSYCFSFPNPDAICVITRWINYKAHQLSKLYLCNEFCIVKISTLIAHCHYTLICSTFMIEGKFIGTI